MVRRAAQSRGEKSLRLREGGTRRAARTQGRKHLEEDGLQLPTVPAAAVATTPGKQNLVCWDSLVGHALITLQHPDDDVGQAVLGLEKEGSSTEATP